MRRFALMVVLPLVLAGTGVEALQTPRGHAQDDRVRAIVYDPYNVTKIVGVIRTSTQVMFADDEEIAHVALGDAVAWEVAPAGNILFLKPRERAAGCGSTGAASRQPVSQIALVGRDERRTSSLTECRYCGFGSRAGRVAPEHNVERIAVLRAELPPCNLIDGEWRRDVDALRSSIRSRRRGGEGVGAGHVGRHSPQAPSGRSSSGRCAQSTGGRRAPLR
jgi:hypothetical protein